MTFIQKDLPATSSRVVATGVAVLAAILALVVPAAASAAERSAADRAAPPSALANKACQGSAVPFCGGVMDAASTLRKLAADGPAEGRELIAEETSRARGACVANAVGCARAAGDLTFSASGYRNHDHFAGPQVPIAATHVYGQGGSSGAAISCFVGVATGAPYFYRGDSRTISYSGSVFCPSGASNVVTMHITSVTLKDASTNATLASAAPYGPYVIGKDGGTTGGMYTRRTNRQLQYITIQAYLDLNSHQWASNGWHVVAPGCKTITRFRVRCDFNSSAFGFVPTTGPGSDALVAFVDGLYDQGDYETDLAIDAMLGAGEPYASMVDALVGNTAGGVIGNTYGLLDVVSGLGNLRGVANCVKSLAKFAAENAFVISKIRKAGGFIKVAKKVLGSRNPSEIMRQLTAGASELVGLDAVIIGCSDFRRSRPTAPLTVG